MSFPTPPLPSFSSDSRPGMLREAERITTANGMAPRVPWDKFVRLMNWQQGEHVGLIGPTGQGKTNLLTHILPIREYVVAFATKPRDSSMDKLIETGYIRQDRWSNIPVERAPRRVLWPNASDIDAEATQKKIFEDAYSAIYREGGWTIAIDEGWFIADVLKLQRQMRTVWTQGRSLGISQVVATQRPRWVPLEMYDQSTHLFFWRDNDDDNLRRISGMGEAPSSIIRQLVSSLEKYQVLYVNTRNGTMMRTRAPAPR